jgi:hypothetical protein
MWNENDTQSRPADGIYKKALPKREGTRLGRSGSGHPRADQRMKRCKSGGRGTTKRIQYRGEVAYGRFSSSASLSSATVVEAVISRLKAIYYRHE